MGQIITIKCMIQLLFLQIILIIAVNAQYKVDTHSNINKTLETVSNVLGSKKQQDDNDYSPSFFRAVIRDKGNRKIKLRWEKTKQVVLNKNLPVYAAQCGPVHEFKAKEAADILNSFVMYQDVEHDSAIIYVKGKELIYGYVGTDYYIHNLPIKHSHKKLSLKVSDPFILKNPKSQIANLINNTESAGYNSATDYLDNNTSNETKTSIISKKILKKSIENQSGGQMTNVNTEKAEKYFLETLLFITHDIIEQVKTDRPDDYLYHILLEYALYFNAVDMVLAKLPTKFRIYINLAGIIFEEDRDVFSSVIDSPIFDYTERNEKLLLDDISTIFSRYYLLDSEFVLQNRSFDHIFISTGRELEYDGVKYPGKSFVGMDLYSLRQSHEQPMIGLPKTIVRQSNRFYDYTIAAHEIGHVLGDYDDVDEWEADTELEDDRCYIMDPNGITSCFNCLNWSPESVTNIENYMRINPNRCWLLNYPQSLHEENERSVYVQPTRQCKCFGYDSFGESLLPLIKYISEDECAKPLKCLKLDGNRFYNESTILPFNGTPCSAGNVKVCWQKECIDATRTKVTLV